MIKTIIIGLLIATFIIFPLVKLKIEEDKRDNFKIAFGFYPSGTNYGHWTGSPDPALKKHEQDLIQEEWIVKYIVLEEIHKEMMGTTSTYYTGLRRLFLTQVENIRDQVNLAHHFGYRIYPDDPDGLIYPENKIIFLEMRGIPEIPHGQ